MANTQGRSLAKGGFGVKVARSFGRPACDLVLSRGVPPLRAKGTLVQSEPGSARSQPTKIRYCRFLCATTPGRPHKRRPGITAVREAARALPFHFRRAPKNAGRDRSLCADR